MRLPLQREADISTVIWSHEEYFAITNNIKIIFNSLQYLREPSRVMVFDATFNNISVISWLPVLLVEETGVPTENHRHIASH